MSTEAIKVEQPELLEVVKESKIDMTKAEAYAANYAPFMIQVNELSQTLKKLDKEKPGDAKTARKQRLALVKVRTAAEAKKKADKEMIVIEGKLIDGLYNVVKNTSMLTEAQYEEIEKHAERVEAERLEKLKQERIALLEPYGIDTTFIALDQMGEDQFSVLLEREKQAHEARLEAERKAEKARIEAERKAEEERIEREKKEAEERERIRKENERLKKEAEEKEAEEKRLAKERQDKFDKNKKTSIKFLSDIGFTSTNGGMEHKSTNHFIGERHYSSFDSDEEMKEWFGEINEIVDKEEERIKEAKKQVEIQAKKDAEIAALKEKEEKRLAAELRAKQEAEEKERALKLAPDKEKINALFLSIKNFEFPEVEDDTAKKIIDEVKQGFKIILDGIKKAAKEIK